jgi:hypothetical protein
MKVYHLGNVRLSIDGEWEESKHPRKRDGKFGTGGVTEKMRRSPKAGQPQTQQKASTATARPASAPKEAAGAPESKVRISPTVKRAFNGAPVDTKTKLTKQETGAIGEGVVVAWMRKQGIPDSHPLNLKTNNFPVDLIGDHQLVEVKSGLVSNGTSAQKWRATIGQPGKKETEWLKTLSPEAKAEWNQQKSQAIMDRKNAVLKAYSKNLGQKVKGRTITVIINPDTKTADLYAFDGFHHSIRWNSEQAKNGYVGSYSYA